MIDRQVLKGPYRYGAALFFLFSVALAQNPFTYGRIRVQGDHPLSREAVLKIIGIKDSDFTDTAAFQGAVQKLQEHLQKTGYPWARVEWKILHEAGFPNYTLFLDIEAGEKGWLRAVAFENNLVFSDRELQAMLSQRTSPLAWLYFSRGKPPRFYPEKMEEDGQRLINAYREKGYFEASVSHRIEREESDHSLVLVWRVDKEGPRYRFGGIVHTGRWPEGLNFRDFSPPVAGGPFDAGIVREHRDRLLRHLRNSGYADSEVVVSTARDGVEQKIHVEFTVQNTGIYRVGAFRIVGNHNVRDHVLLREIPQSGGDVFDQGALETGLFKIQLLPMIDAAGMTYRIDPSRRVVDVELQVREKRSGRFEGGVVYGEQEGAALQLNVRDQNLSMRPPWRGEAIQGSLEATIGNRILRGVAGLTVPRVWESPYTLDHTLSYLDNRFSNRNYKQKQFAAQSIGLLTLENGGLLGAGLGLTNFELYDISQTMRERLIEGDDKLFLTSLVLLWNQNRTDHLRRPTRGYRARATLKLGSQYLGGDEDILELGAQCTGFLNTYGKHVLAATVGVQHLVPYGDSDRAPLPIRLYLGGTSNLRGFAYQSVSPADEEGNVQGGESMWWANLEYILPLTSRFDLSVYVGGGEVVSPGNQAVLSPGIVSHAGLGLLIRADNFPVRFDVAMPLDVAEWDPENEKGRSRISFSAGFQF